MPPIMKQYYAFISYKRDDQKWAEWLQEKLEHYKLPSNLNGRDSLPKEIRPVFRDKSELAAGVLADEIQKALDNSKYLIVICSPHSAKSEWVNKEVQAFIDSGRTDKIIPFIIEGTPNSGNDETECFPKAIRELPAEDELLGVNINEMGRDAAAVKVVAQMFGLRFDDLWQRHEREKKRRRHLITTAITAFTIAVICVAGWIWHQNVVLKQQRWQMLESQSKFIAKEIVSNAEDNSYLARRVALDILPQNVNNPKDRPYTAEAENALRKALSYNTAMLVKNDTLDNITLIAYNPKGKQFLFGGDYMKTDSVMSDGSYYRKGYLFVCDAQTFNIRCVADMGNVFVSGIRALCSYSPDGESVLLYNISDSTLRELDAVTIEERRVYKVDAGYKCIAYNHDGSDIICTNDSITCVIDAISGNIKYSIKHKNDRPAYDFNNYWGEYNGKIINFESDTVINVRNVITGDLLVSFMSEECYEFNHYPIKVSPDGNYLACRRNKIKKMNDDFVNCEHDFDSTIGIVNYKGKISQEDSIIVVYDLKSYREIGRVYANMYTDCWNFSDDSKWILTGNGKKICIWNTATCEKIKTLSTNVVVGGCILSHNSNYIAYYPYELYKYRSKTDSVCLTICETTTSHILKTIKCSFNIEELLFNPDDNSVLFCEGNEIRLSDIGINDNNYIVTKTQTGNMSPVISPDNKLLAVRNDRAKISIIDIEKGKVSYVLYEKADGSPLSFSPDGTSLIYRVWGSNDSNGRLMKWRYDNEDDTMTIKLIFNDIDSIWVNNRWYSNSDSIRDKITGAISCLKYNKEGDRFITTSYVNNRVSVWDAETMIEIKSTEENAPPKSASFSLDGQNFVLIKDFCSASEILSVKHDKKTFLRGKESVVEHYGNYFVSTYSPEGDKIIINTSNGFDVFSAETGKLLQTISGHDGVVNSIMYSPNGKYIITSSNDKTIRVWDVETMKCIYVIYGHTNNVEFAAFAPDGKHIISASQDSTIRIWDFTPLQELIDSTRERFKNRPLTDEEKKMYYLE